MTDKKVTGKKILEDCVVLAKDIGVFAVYTAKRAYAAIKNILADKKETDSVDAKNIERSSVKLTDPVKAQTATVTATS